MPKSRRPPFPGNEWREMLLYEGHRMLVGGGMPSRDRKRAVYLFVMATLVDPSGNMIKMPNDRDETDVPVKQAPEY